MTGIFVILLSQDGFESDYPKINFQTITSSKVTAKKSIVEIWTVISNQMIKHQFPRTWSDQISDNKHNVHLYRELSTLNRYRKQLIKY